MRKEYEEIIERDNDGNIIFEQHSDGFREESQYVKGKLVKQTTRYSNGMVETDYYTYPDDN